MGILMVRLALDFDGVLCDSVHEAFYSTWIAYYRHQRSHLPHQITLKMRDTFYRYRPYIRTGQHLMLLQHIIWEGGELHNQDDFERALSVTPDAVLQQWREWLYQVREEIRAEDHAQQLRLQPLYPGMRELLIKLSSAAGVIILSTKRADFIAGILSHNHVPWDNQHILSVHKESKIEALQRLREESRKAHRSTHADSPQPLITFIDDHLPHLLSQEEAQAHGMRCLLATWGYVVPEWCRNQHYETIDLKGFRSLISSLILS